MRSRSPHVFWLMPDQEAINDAIESALTDPKRVRVGNEEVEQHSLSDRLRAADKAAANIQVASSGRLIFNKISPPGAV